MMVPYKQIFISLAVIESPGGVSCSRGPDLKVREEKNLIQSGNRPANQFHSAKTHIGTHLWGLSSLDAVSAWNINLIH